MGRLTEEINAIFDKLGFEKDPKHAIASHEELQKSIEEMDKRLEKKFQEIDKKRAESFREALREGIIY